jgi:hypothetical protein
MYIYGNRGWEERQARPVAEGIWNTIGKMEKDGEILGLEAIFDGCTCAQSFPTTSKLTFV